MLAANYLTGNKTGNLVSLGLFTGSATVTSPMQ